MDGLKTIIDEDGKEILISAVRRPSRTKTLPDGTTEEVLGFVSHYADLQGKQYFPVSPDIVSDGENEYKVKPES